MTTTSWEAMTLLASAGLGMGPAVSGYATGRTCWLIPGARLPSGTHCSQRRRSTLPWRLLYVKKDAHLHTERHLHGRVILCFQTLSTKCLSNLIYINLSLHFLGLWILYRMIIYHNECIFNNIHFACLIMCPFDLYIFSPLPVDGFGNCCVKK